MAKLTEPPESRKIFTSSITRHAGPYSAIDPTRQELSAQGKVVLITGGGQGIGLSIALGFAKAKASHIILLGRTLSTLASGQAKILEANPAVKVHTFVADVTDSSAISTTFSKINEEIGQINICVSNASYMSGLAPIAGSDISDWFRSFEVMHKAEKDAAFISISSSAIQMGTVQYFSSYACAKMGIGKAMEYLQSENPDVRVLSVHPGTIRSEMSEKTQKAYGVELTFDEYEMPGCFCVWATSPEADFLGGRFVWAAWDVEELVAKKEILKNDILRFGIVQ